MNIAPISAKSYNAVKFQGQDKAKQAIEIKNDGDDVTFKMPRGLAYKVLPYMTPFLLTGPTAVSLSTLNGCAKDGISVVAPEFPVSNAKQNVVQKEIINVWKALDIDMSGDDGINPDEQIQSVNRMSYFDVRYGVQYDKELKEADSTKAVYYVTQNSGGLPIYGREIYTKDEDGNLVVTSQTAFPFSEYPNKYTEWTQPYKLTYVIGADNIVRVKDKDGKLIETQTRNTSHSINITTKNGGEEASGVLENIKIN